MDLFLAGDYIFSEENSSRFDIGYIYNRLLSYDYQKKFVDEIISRKKCFGTFLEKSKDFDIVRRRKYMELFFAGVSEIDRPKEGSNVLMTFESEKHKENFSNIVDLIKPPKVFVDSGAFSAWTKGIKISTKDYIKWLNERAGEIDLCGQVDVIPGDRVFGATLSQIREAAEGTLRNYIFMRGRMENPDSLLYTFHVGEPLEYLKKVIDMKFDGKQVSYIALGGMVGKPHQVRDRFLNNCFTVIKNSSNPNVNVHAFGMTDFDLLEKYPITSADSTSWIMVG